MTRTVIRELTDLGNKGLVFDQPGDYLIVAAPTRAQVADGEGVVTIGVGARALILDGGSLFGTTAGNSLRIEGGFVSNHGIIENVMMSGENGPTSVFVNNGRVFEDVTISGDGNYLRNAGQIEDLAAIDANTTLIVNSGWIEDRLIIGDGPITIRNLASNGDHPYITGGDIWMLRRAPSDDPAHNTEGLTLRNAGFIESLFLDAGNLADAIYNTGTINSPARLGGGDDVFLGHNGLQFQVLGGDGNDYIRGSDTTVGLPDSQGIETLFGDAGDDFLISGRSDGDILFGGKGNDRIVGSSFEGDTTIAYYFGDTEDFLFEQRANGAVIVTDMRTEETHPDAFLQGRDVLTDIDILEFWSNGQTIRIDLADYFG